MQAAVIITHTTIQRPMFTDSLGGCSIEAKVKETVVWNEIFLTLVARFLIHATDTRREFPTVKLVGNVTQVIGQSM